ncbi:MAG: hypothetical protein ABIR84_01445 [Candidatus Nitrotoga sp.]
MQYVQSPSLPPSLSGLEDQYEVKRLTEIQPVKPITERTQPSLVFRSLRSEQQHNLVKPPERRSAETYLGERRKICRRIKTQPFLKELRSTVDRRRHKQRKSDITEHIDEVA